MIPDDVATAIDLLLKEVESLVSAFRQKGADAMTKEIMKQQLRLCNKPSRLKVLGQDKRVESRVAEKLQSTDL